MKKKEVNIYLSDKEMVDIINTIEIVEMGLPFDRKDLALYFTRIELLKAKLNDSHRLELEKAKLLKKKNEEEAL